MVRRICFRHRFAELAQSKGEPTGAIYGVINMLMKLRHAYDSQYFIVVAPAFATSYLLITKPIAAACQMI